MSPENKSPLAHHPEDSANDHAEFEIGKHRVPWFLWLFFAIIISWASIAWFPFFGY
jgi:hypothetical protein